MIDLSLLNNLIDERYVTRDKHPCHDLYIYNYTSKTSSKELWNDVTKKTRGLVLNSRGDVVARPFEKFFDHTKIAAPELKAGDSFKAFEKIDGILGISYWVEEKIFITTRGAFDSFQSMIANKILNRKYPDLSKQLDKNYTYLFEIVSPLTRVIVDYGDEEDLFLLGVIETETGKELNLADIENNPFPLPKMYGQFSINNMNEFDSRNREGFVLRNQEGLRIKLRFPDYIKRFDSVRRYKDIIIEAFVKGREIESVLHENNIEDEDHFIWLFTQAAGLSNYLKEKFRIMHQLRKSDSNNFIIQSFSYEIASALIPACSSENNIRLRELFKKLFVGLFFRSQYYSTSNPYDRKFLNL